MAGIKLLDKTPQNLNFIVNELLKPEVKNKLFDDVYGQVELGMVFGDPRTAIYGIFEKGLPKPIGVVFFVGIIPYRNCFLYAAIFDKDNRKKGKMSSVMKIIEEDMIKRFAIHTVTTYVIGKNPASEASLKKMGFSKLGTRKEAIVVNGAYKDLTTYFRLLKDEKEE